jgi:hypothetical protein
MKFRKENPAEHKPFLTMYITKFRKENPGEHKHFPDHTLRNSEKKTLENINTFPTIYYEIQKRKPWRT